MKIEMKDLEFGYDQKTQVLKDVSLEFKRPEFVCIMGPNGVGKSTLIHCINKILKPTGGSVLLDGRSVSEMKLKEVAEHLGYVPAASEDVFPLTVADAVMVGLQNQSGIGDGKDDIQKVYEALKMMRIEHLALRNFNELSAGQHQKVMLARGLVRCPEAVLLDEPTSNLDIRHQIQVMKTLSSLPKTKGMLVIMISHDINITAKYADRIIMLHDGKVFADGAPTNVLTKENLRTVYGVDADIIYVRGHPHVILNDDAEDRAREGSGRGLGIPPDAGMESGM